MHTDGVRLRAFQFSRRDAVLANLPELIEQTGPRRVFLAWRRSDVRDERTALPAFGQERVNRVAQRALLAQLVEEAPTEPARDPTNERYGEAVAVESPRSGIQHRDRALRPVAW